MLQLSGSSFPSGTSGKKLPANAGDIRNQVLSLGWEDPLEKGMATHSSVFAWKIPTDRGACQATVCRVAKRPTKLKRLNTYVVEKLSELLNLTNQ